jgi:hypothetical protein
MALRTTLPDSPADPRAAAVQAFADALASAKSPLGCDRVLAQVRALVGIGMAQLAIADAINAAAARAPGGWPPVEPPGAGPPEVDAPNAAPQAECRFCRELGRACEYCLAEYRLASAT